MPAPDNSENSVQIATNSTGTIATDPAITVTLSEMCKTLTELQPLASKITDLKKQTLEKEVSILKAILEKLTPLVPLLSEDCEHGARMLEMVIRKQFKICISHNRIHMYLKAEGLA